MAAQLVDGAAHGGAQLAAEAERSATQAKYWDGRCRIAVSGLNRIAAYHGSVDPLVITMATLSEVGKLPGEMT